MSSNGGEGGRAVQVGVWVLCVLEAVTMGLAGVAKFAAPDVWTGLFAGWGYPSWFAFVIGGVEVTGAVGLLVPRLTAWAGSVLVAVMTGALATVLVHDSALGPVAPTLHLVGLSVLIRMRWRRRWRP